MDGSLRLCHHSPELAAVLLRDRPGFSFEGTKFQDLVATSWEAREAALQLNRGDEAEEPIAQSFHTRLVDSCSSKFRTEVFHVKYCKPDWIPTDRQATLSASATLRTKAPFAANLPQRCLSGTTVATLWFGTTARRISQAGALQQRRCPTWFC